MLAVPRHYYSHSEENFAQSPCQGKKELVPAQEPLHRAPLEPPEEDQEDSTKPSFTRPTVPCCDQCYNGEHGTADFLEVCKVCSGTHQVSCILPPVRRQARKAERSDLLPSSYHHLPDGRLGKKPELEPRLVRLEPMEQPGAHDSREKGKGTYALKRSETKRPIWKRTPTPKGEQGRWERKEREKQGQGQKQTTRQRRASMDSTGRHSYPGSPTESAITADTRTSSPETACRCPEEESGEPQRRCSGPTTRSQRDKHADHHQASHSCCQGAWEGQAGLTTGTCSETGIACELEELLDRSSGSLGGNGCQLCPRRRCHGEEHQRSAEQSGASQDSPGRIQTKHGCGTGANNRLFGRRGHGDRAGDRGISQNDGDDANTPSPSRSFRQGGRKGSKEKEEVGKSKWWRRLAACLAIGFSHGRQDVTRMYDWQRPGLSGIGLIYKWLHPLVQSSDFISPWSAAWNAFLDEGICQERAPAMSILSNTRIEPSTKAREARQVVRFHNEADLYVWEEQCPEGTIKIVCPHDALFQWEDKPWRLALQPDDHSDSLIAQNQPTDETSLMQRHRMPSGLSRIVTSPHTPIHDWKQFVLEQMSASISMECDNVAQYQTWYIDHMHHKHCFEPRAWLIDDGPFDWERQPRQLWYDLIDSHQNLRIYVVSPHVRQLKGETLSLGHILLVQGTGDYVATLLSSPAIRGLHHRSIIIATSTFRRSTGRHILRLIGMTAHCDELPCTVWLHPDRLALHEAALLHDGAHIEVTPAAGPGGASTFHDGSTISDHVSWLQGSIKHHDFLHNDHGRDHWESVPLSDELAVSNCPADLDQVPNRGIREHFTAARHDGHPATAWFGIDHYTRSNTDHPWNDGSYPAWTTEIWQQVYATQAEENRRGIETIEMYTWYIDSGQNSRCHRDRPVELGPEWWAWEEQLRWTWRDKIQADRALNVHLVFPA